MKITAAKAGAIAGLLVLAVLPFACDREHRELTDADRAGKPGEFVKLSAGVTHYEAGGPATGRPVILIHGFSMPYFIWDFVFKDLTSRGFRVIRLDLYGRGLSDRPNVDYGPDLYDRQVTDLLDHLHITRTSVIGSSMGGLVAVSFMARHPERVHRAVLIAPAGFPMPLPFAARLARMPGIGDYLVRVIGDRSFRRGTETSFHSGVPAAFAMQFEEQTQYRGYKRALLSSLRHMPLESAVPVFEQAGRAKVRTLVLWAREDRVLPYENASGVARTLGARLVTLEGTGHTPHYENPELVLPHIVQFLE